MKQAILFTLFICLLFGTSGLLSSPAVQAQTLGNQAAYSGNPQAAATNTPQATARPSTYERPLVIVAANSYDPGKTYAGSKFTLSAKLKNQGQKTAYNIVITFSGSDVQPQTNGGVVIIPSLAPDESVTITQDLLIKSSVSVYQTSIDEAVEYKDENGASFSQKFTAAINVYWYSRSSTPTVTPTATSTPAGRPRIVVSGYTIDNQTLQPGATFKLTLNIQNLGTNDAHNVSLALGSSTSGSSTTTATTFLPMGSSNIKVLGDLGAQKGLELQQSYIVNSSTAAGAYPLSLSFSYRDDGGASLTDEQIITLLVYMVPSIDIGFYETPGTFTVGSKTNLPIQVVNLASAAVLLGNINVSMESATLANNTLFIGTLDGGGTFTMDTDLTPQKNGAQTLKVTINYQDNFKNPQTITKNLQITVGGGNTSGGAGQTFPNPATTPGAQVTTPGATRGNNPFTAQPTSENLWQVILRFVRGMIGFDSAPVQASTNPSFFQVPSFNATPSGAGSPTATPGR